MKISQSKARFSEEAIRNDELKKSSSEQILRVTSITRLAEQSIEKQYKIAGSLYIGQMLVGYVLGWTAPIIPKLKDIEQTPLQHVFSDSQASWLGSSLYFGCTSGPYISGYLCNKVGRRPCLVLGGVICLLGFTALAMAESIGFMYMGRVLTGLSNGILFVTNLVYIGEIASPRIRGRLLTMTGLSTSLGTLVVYTVGPFVPFQVTCFLAVFTAFVYLFLIVMWVPETPVYQVMKGYRGEAIINLRKLGRREDYASIEAAASDEQKSTKDRLHEMFTHKANIKALFILIILNISQQMSGYITVIFFVTTIFDLTGSSMPSNVSTIIIGITQVLSALVTSFFVDLTGRKSLLLFSTAGCSLSLLTLGSYFYLHNTRNPVVKNLHWLSLTSLIFFLVFYNMGFGIIPSTFIGEMFTSDVRSFGSSFTVSVDWIVGFVVATTFGYMVPAFGAHSTFWMYSGACAFAFCFTVFFVPETKGKTLLQIQEMLNK